MANKTLLASVALTAGLLGGGVAGFVLGAPGVSGAQTTTVPNQNQAPSTAPGGGQTNPDRPPHDGKNCPNMGGQGGSGGQNQAPANGAATDAGSYHRGFGGGATWR